MQLFWGGEEPASKSAARRKVQITRKISRTLVFAQQLWTAHFILYSSPSENCKRKTRGHWTSGWTRNEWDVVQPASEDDECRSVGQSETRMAQVIVWLSCVWSGQNWTFECKPGLEQHLLHIFLVWNSVKFELVLWWWATFWWTPIHSMLAFVAQVQQRRCNLALRGLLASVQDPDHASTQTKSLCNCSATWLINLPTSFMIV